MKPLEKTASKIAINEKYLYKRIVKLKDGLNLSNGKY